MCIDFAVSLNDLPEPPLRNPSRDERKSSVGGGSGSRGGARRTGSGGGGRSGGRKLGMDFEVKFVSVSR